MVCSTISSAFGLLTCRCIDAFKVKSFHGTLVAALLLANVGLFMIDHIHFQYNGILIGLLLISISHMIKGNYLLSAIFYTILLNMKHIFIYMAPVYIAYLLKFYCWNNKVIQGLKNLVKLAVITLGITALSFGPFYDHIPQVSILFY